MTEALDRYLAEQGLTGKSVWFALTRFLEANQATTRDRKLSRKIRPFQRQIAGHFKEQGKQFANNLRVLQPVIDATAKRESVSQSDWGPYWNMAARATFADFSDDVGSAILSALIMGGGQLFETLQTDAGELGISWNLENPRAVAYAEQHAAAQVTKINDTTRSYLNSLITSAVADGTSYTELARLIEEKFVEFATGGKNPRSRRIAVYELGDAYEAGQDTAADLLEDAGIDLQVKWLTVGDDNVRPSHRDSQLEGWQDRGHTFASGAERPPTDPGCRCVRLFRRKRA